MYGRQINFFICAFINYIIKICYDPSTPLGTSQPLLVYRTNWVTQVTWCCEPNDPRLIWFRWTNWTYVCLVQSMLAISTWLLWLLWVLVSFNFIICYQIELIFYYQIAFFASIETHLLIDLFYCLQHSSCNENQFWLIFCVYFVEIEIITLEFFQQWVLQAMCEEYFFLVNFVDQIWYPFWIIMKLWLIQLLCKKILKDIITIFSRFSNLTSLTGMTGRNLIFSYFKLLYGYTTLICLQIKNVVLFLQLIFCMDVHLNRSNFISDNFWRKGKILQECSKTLTFFEVRYE